MNILTNNDSHFRKFSFTRITAVSGRVFKQFGRDRQTLAMVVIMPILFMFVFGITLSGEIKNIPISIEIADEGFIHPETHEEINFSEMIRDLLLENEGVEIQFTSYTEGRTQVDKNNFVASILFPLNFTADLVTDKNTSIIIYIDGTKPQIKMTVYNAINEALQEVLGGRGINLDEELAFGGAEFSGLDVAIPGVMGYILTFLILLLTVLTVIREDIGKTKLRLYTTPLTSIERILGYPRNGGQIEVNSLNVG